MIVIVIVIGNLSYRHTHRQWGFWGRGSGAPGAILLWAEEEKE